MSTTALTEYNDARIQQTTQNDARRIRTRVQAAQNSDRAGVQWRWPFELIQNAHDAGPRNGNDQVRVKFVLQDTRLKVSHTGKSFTAQEFKVGQLPALHDQDGDTVSFLVPSINRDKEDYINYDTIHNLALAVTTLHIPRKDVASDWNHIAQKWAGMSVQVDLLGFEELANLVKEEYKFVRDLPLNIDPFSWLTDFFLLATELNKDYHVDHIVDGLVPDQHSKLCPSSDIYIDGGISEEIKDIADSIDFDLRSKLLHNNMEKALKQPGYESAYELIRELFSGEYSESEATAYILEKLDDILPEDSTFESESGLLALYSSARLAVYLGQREDIQYLRRCPLLTADDTIVHLTGNKQILAPVSHWPESARPYADLYTKNRMLSDRYCSDENLASAIDLLVLAGLVIPAPLFVGRRAEIQDANLLRAMSLYGLVDAGYDYEVHPGSLDGEFDDTFWRFEVENYLLEVKATTTGEVRLTPLQAETASKCPDRFILCVIDLREQEPKQVWEPSEIAPFAKIVTDMGTDVIDVFTEVKGLSSPDKSVRLRNDQMLRYGVSLDLWQNGISIDEWVQTLKADYIS